MAISSNLDRDFLEMMTETVTIAPKTGQNEFNEPTYGTPVTYQARVTGKIMELRDPRGQEVTATFSVWLDTVDNVLPDDQLTLSSGVGWGPDLTPQIFTVRRVTDEGGHSHLELACGWQYHRQGQ